MVKKGEVLNRLDAVKDMSNAEIAISADWIKETATAAYALIKNKESK